MYERTLEQTRYKFKALVPIYKRTDMFRKTSSGIYNFVEELKTLVMMKRMKIIVSFQTKVQKKRRKSPKIIYLHQKEKKWSCICL